MAKEVWSSVESSTERLATELRQATDASKCRRCGCYQDTVQALAGSARLAPGLAALVAQARASFESRRYDCLGCEVCWPALAANAAAELDPGLAQASPCPTEAPAVRHGWPPLPGDYQVLRFRAPVAVCTLNSDALLPRLAAAHPPGMAIVGSLHTENLGIEHLIRNLLPNPNVRYLLVCGEDTRRAVGHLPGQSLISLLQNGLETDGRIRNARGKRPVIKNLSREHAEAFRRRTRVVDLIGTTDIEVIAEQVALATAEDPGPAVESVDDVGTIPMETVVEPKRLVLDPAGYLVIYPDRNRGRLVLEHYSNDGALTRVLEGKTPAALYGAGIAHGLISRLDHAAYLGRELARAEAALHSGAAYVQDRAPGETEMVAKTGKGCGCTT